MNRRSMLTTALLALAARRLSLSAWTSRAEAQEKRASLVWRHGASLFGDLKYPPGFKQFDYVNAKAPKGGAARQIALGTYDIFNMVVDGVKGALAVGIDLNYDTLLVAALDEVSSGYGLLSEAVSCPDDFSSASFRLRAEAKWHDGTAVTTEDVIFSFDTFKKLSPQAGANYKHVVKAAKTGEREVTFTFGFIENKRTLRSVPLQQGRMGWTVRTSRTSKRTGSADGLNRSKRCWRAPARKH